MARVHHCLDHWKIAGFTRAGQVLRLPTLALLLASRYSPKLF
jgi:hypothetical protein